MARTPSTMAPLGSIAPAFSLPDTDGNEIRLDYFGATPATLVIFLCNHCPFVVHIREELAKVTTVAMKKGIAVFGINANDAEKYPDDSPEKMVEEKNTAGYPFPYLFDATQTTARAYDAACTPDFFLYDKDRRLIYRGQFDDSRPGNGIPVSGKDLKAALMAVIANHPISEKQVPSLGCNIKWKP